MSTDCLGLTTKSSPIPVSILPLHLHRSLMGLEYQIRWGLECLSWSASWYKVMLVLGDYLHDASNNDVMVNKLVDLLPEFPGPANHCRCFLRIINLVAKTLLRQFEVPKKDTDAALNASEQELLELAAGTDMEEMITIAKDGLGNSNDDIDGWVDKMDLLSEEESENLHQSIQPIWLVPVKVRNDWIFIPVLMAAPGSSESLHLRSFTRQ